MVDRKRFEKKVLLDLASSPLTLVPAVGGLTAVAAGWALAIPALAFGGVVGVLAGAGTFLTRLATGSEKVTDRALEDLRKENAKARDAELDALLERLEADGEPRSDGFLRDLRLLYDQAMASEGLKGMDSVSRGDMERDVNSLFNGCVSALEQSLKVREVAMGVTHKTARKEILRRREALLREVGQSVEKLSLVVARLEAMSVEGSAVAELKALRVDLDESLTQARKVRDEMRALDGSGTSLAGD